MRFRKLRIAWTVGWSLLTLLLLVWWVRSYWLFDFAYGINGNTYQPTIKSVTGSVYVGYFPRKGDPPGNSMPMTHISRPRDSGRIDDYLMPFDVELDRDSQSATLPFWFLATTTSLLGASVWVPRRFSLRTLFIAMTFAAILPGLIVWSRRIANPFVPTPDQFYSKLANFVEQRDFRAAGLVLENVDIEAQARYAVKRKDLRWMAVQEDTLVVPGVEECVAIALKPSEVWIIPGTFATNEDWWQWGATELAKDYNESLKAEMSKGK